MVCNSPECHVLTSAHFDLTLMNNVTENKKSEISGNFCKIISKKCNFQQNNFIEVTWLVLHT